MKTPAMLLLLLAACQGTPRDVPPPPQPADAPVAAAVSDPQPVFRTYRVPAGRAEEVSHVLRRALSQGADTPPRGTVDRLEDGRLVVLAPPSVQEGIAGLCADLEEAGVAAPPRTIKLSYWLVVAKPGDSEDGTLPALLGPALEEIEAQDGPAVFELFESTAIAAQENAEGDAHGRFTQIEHVASIVDDAIVASIKIESDRGSKMETRLALPPGELVILGHAGRSVDDRSEARLYYIVRAETV